MGGIENMIHIAFCDDDFDFIKNVIPLVEAEFQKNNLQVDCSVFTEGEKLLEVFKLRKEHFDLIFLDIDMPKMDGKVIAKKLRLMDKTFKLIFVTAYENEALNMFQYDVVGFVPKNRLEVYLSSSIERAIDKMKEEIPQIFVLQIYEPNKLEKYVDMKLRLNDIILFESVNKKVYVKTVHENYQLYHIQYSKLVDKFIEFGFLDIHRTCIVNSKYVSAIGEKDIYLDTGEVIGMSRRKRKEVLAQMAGILYKEVLS